MKIDRPEILSLTPADFAILLNKNNVAAAHFVTQPDPSNPSATRLVASHEFLQPIADYFQSVSDRGRNGSETASSDDNDYDRHEAFFISVGPVSGVLQGAFIHRTCRGPAAGGVRNWIYDDIEGYFRDGLRLSKGMTHKNALAGIHWGGGKGVICRNSGVGLMPDASAESRRIVYEEYGSFMSSLHGCYVTAEDVGTSVNDMAAVFSRTRHKTCIPPELGGSGNPSVPTARGIVRGLQAAFDFLGKPIQGSTIAVMGAGHVGIPLIQFLFDIGVGKIIASDIDSHRADSIRSTFATKKFELHIVSKQDTSILCMDVDAVAPCATGGILNSNTIPHIRAPIVCGAANNQLLDLDHDDQLLHQKNILYLPDFVVNRMGIVNCCDEHMGVMDNDPKLDDHLGSTHPNAIYNLCTRILVMSKETGQTPQRIAIGMAEDMSMHVHPLYGHRSLQIIKWLVHSDEWKKKMIAKPKSVNGSTKMQ